MSSHRKQRLFAKLAAPAAGLALLLGIAPAAIAQEKSFDLPLSHRVPPTHPLRKAREDRGASVPNAAPPAAQGSASWAASSPGVPEGHRPPARAKSHSRHLAVTDTCACVA